MWGVLTGSWALFLGMLFLMMGNGLQGTLLGVRGAMEGFSAFEMSVVMSGYFIGFLGGSKVAPEMIRRVGHVRVFAALASFVSVVLILYPVLVHPVSWTLGRIAIGFCFSGVYVAAESWLNNSAENANRGKALSIYMIVQMAGVVAAQAMLAYGDASGYVLFVISSVLVSISFAPILLSVAPTPAFDTAKPMSIRELIKASPLGCMGMFLLGGVFSAQFGMAAVYGTEAGLTIGQISTFVASIYIGALLLQYPIGWLSDRMDRRFLILGVGIFGALGAATGAFAGGDIGFTLILAAGFITGGAANPLYSLLIAYTNDYLASDDMAAASGGLIFINGVGAISGPMLTGWAMSWFGPRGFFIYITFILGVLSLYALYRMTVRSATSVEDSESYTPVLPTAGPVAIEVAAVAYSEASSEEE